MNLGASTVLRIALAVAASAILLLGLGYYLADGKRTVSTAGWKTHTNQSHGYSIKYPSNWEFSANESGGVDFYEEGKTYQVDGSTVAVVSIFSESNVENKAAKDIAISRQDSMVSRGLAAEVRESQLADLPAAQMTDPLGVRTYVVKEGKTFVIATPTLTADQNKDIQRIYSAMIKTFTFAQ